MVPGQRGAYVRLCWACYCNGHTQHVSVYVSCSTVLSRTQGPVSIFGRCWQRPPALRACCDTADQFGEHTCAALMAFSSAVGRLSVLSQHLSADCEQNTLQRQDTRADEEVRPAPGGGPGTLTVLDNRTGKKYTVRDDPGV
jgi:hypothetical protein